MLDYVMQVMFVLLVYSDSTVCSTVYSTGTGTTNAMDVAQVAQLVLPVLAWSTCKDVYCTL